MARLRYDLKLLFVAMSNVCVLAWAMTSQASSTAPLLVAIVASLSCVWYGSKKSKRPKIVLGAQGGFAGIAPLIICVFIGHFYDCIYDTGNPNYFEDGAFMELVVFPSIVFVCFGGFGAIVGMICGAAVWGIQKLMSNINRSYTNTLP